MTYTLEDLRSAPLYSCLEGPAERVGNTDWQYMASSDAMVSLPQAVLDEVRVRGIRLDLASELGDPYVIVSTDEVDPANLMDEAALKFLDDGNALVKLPFDGQGVYYAWYAVVGGCPQPAEGAGRGSRWRSILERRLTPNGPRGYTRQDFSDAPDGTVLFGPVDPDERLMPEMVDETKPGGWLLAVSQIDEDLVRAHGVEPLPGEYVMEPQKYLAADYGGAEHPGWSPDDRIAAVAYVASGGAVVKLVDPDGYDFYVAIEPPTGPVRGWRQIVQQRLRPNARAISRQDVLDAEPFTIFHGLVDFQAPADAVDAYGVKWFALFDVPDSHDEAVDQELVARGIDFDQPGQHPEIDVEWAQGRSGTDQYDDVDAALGYLAEGGAVIKIPDALSGPNARYFRLYAIQPPEAADEPAPTHWRDILRRRQS